MKEKIKAILEFFKILFSILFDLLKWAIDIIMALFSGEKIVLAIVSALVVLVISFMCTLIPICMASNNNMLITSIIIATSSAIIIEIITQSTVLDFCLDMVVGIIFYLRLKEIILQYTPADFAIAIYTQPVWIIYSNVLPVVLTAAIYSEIIDQCPLLHWKKYTK